MGESKSLCRVLATQMGRKILDIFGVELCVFPKSYVRNGSQLPMLLRSHSRRVLSGGAVPALPHARWAASVYSVRVQPVSGMQNTCIAHVVLLAFTSLCADISRRFYPVLPDLSHPTLPCERHWRRPGGERCTGNTEYCAGCKQVNATAFRQWRPWLRGADLNRRPLGYAI